MGEIERRCCLARATYALRAWNCTLHMLVRMLNSQNLMEAGRPVGGVTHLGDAQLRRARFNQSTTLGEEGAERCRGPGWDAVCISGGRLRL
jgi:hypothetical protein